MTLERFKQFSKHEHMLMIASELKRAIQWQKSQTQLFDATLKRCMRIAEFMLNDPKWQPMQSAVHGLHRELSAYQSGKKSESIERLYRAL